MPAESRYIIGTGVIITFLTVSLSGFNPSFGFGLNLDAYLFYIGLLYVVLGIITLGFEGEPSSAQSLIASTVSIPLFFITLTLYAFFDFTHLLSNEYLDPTFTEIMVGQVGSTLSIGGVAFGYSIGHGARDSNTTVIRLSVGLAILLFLIAYVIASAKGAAPGFIEFFFLVLLLGNGFSALPLFLIVMYD